MAADVFCRNPLVRLCLDWYLAGLDPYSPHQLGEGFRHTQDIDRRSFARLPRSYSLTPNKETRRLSLKKCPAFLAGIQVTMMGQLIGNATPHSHMKNVGCAIYRKLGICWAVPTALWAPIARRKGTGFCNRPGENEAAGPPTSPIVHGNYKLLNLPEVSDECLTSDKLRDPRFP